MSGNVEGLIQEARVARRVFGSDQWLVSLHDLSAFPLKGEISLCTPLKRKEKL
jgi:hypothetical protein